MTEVLVLEIKPPTQEEKDAVLYDLVMAKRAVTHLGGGIYVNADGRKVNPDGSETVASQPSTAAANTVFTDPSGKKYAIQGGTLVELTQHGPGSISTPNAPFNQVRENASVNQASGSVEPSGITRYTDGTYSDASGRRFNADGTPYGNTEPSGITHYADGGYSDASGRRFNADGTPYVSATQGSSGL
jgi:hypothetical protein